MVRSILLRKKAALHNKDPDGYGSIAFQEKMKTEVHLTMLRTILGEAFSPGELGEVIWANLDQDSWKYQVGHDHVHFDNNSFTTAFAYCDGLRSGVLSALNEGAYPLARERFGRLTHTMQDLYAHSNYVELWMEKADGRPAVEIDPDDQGIFADPRLQSGKLYYPAEVVTFLPGIPPWVIELFPADSHARMNKDGPNRPGFDYALQAALKRTQMEFDQIKKMLDNQQLQSFCGKDKKES